MSLFKYFSKQPTEQANVEKGKGQFIVIRIDINNSTASFTL